MAWKNQSRRILNTSLRASTQALLLLGASIYFMASSLGCYSFTGAALPPHIKTIAIPIFNDESRSGVPNLRERLTQELTQRVQTQSPLIIEQSRTQAHSIIEAVVTAYSDVPSVIGGQTERATQNRITIRVSATYRDLVKKKILFKQDFNGVQDYPIGNFQAQQQAIARAITTIADDMLNRILSGW